MFLCISHVIQGFKKKKQPNKEHSNFLSAWGNFIALYFAPVEIRGFESADRVYSSNGKKPLLASRMTPSSHPGTHVVGCGHHQLDQRSLWTGMVHSRPKPIPIRYHSCRIRSMDLVVFVQRVENGWYPTLQSKPHPKLQNSQNKENRFLLGLQIPIQLRLVGGTHLLLCFTQYWVQIEAFLGHSCLEKSQEE